MELVEMIVIMVDNMLNTERKRRIVGGTLLSTSLFFGGLAITVMSIKTEDKV